MSSSACSTAAHSAGQRESTREERSARPCSAHHGGQSTGSSGGTPGGRTQVLLSMSPRSSSAAGMSSVGSAPASWSSVSSSSSSPPVPGSAPSGSSSPPSTGSWSSASSDSSAGTESPGVSSAALSPQP